MTKSNAMENNLLQLIFQAVTFNDIAQNDASAPLTNIMVSLHTADPGEAATQTTNEIPTGSYGAYIRVAVARTTAGWKVTTNVASPVANISFAQSTSGTGTVTHFGLGHTTSGAGAMLYSGTVTPNIAVASGVTPILTTGSTITES